MKCRRYKPGSEQMPSRWGFSAGERRHEMPSLQTWKRANAVEMRIQHGERRHAMPSLQIWKRANPVEMRIQRGEQVDVDESRTREDWELNTAVATGFYPVEIR
jgi:hypothetical protein